MSIRQEIYGFFTSWPEIPVDLNLSKCVLYSASHSYHGTAPGHYREAPTPLEISDLGLKGRISKTRCLPVKVESLTQPPG